MAKLEAQIKLDELSQAMARSKSSSTGPGSSNSSRTQFSDEEVSRLIYARTALDFEFQQHVNSGFGKWPVPTGLPPADNMRVARALRLARARMQRQMSLADFNYKAN